MLDRPTFLAAFGQKFPHSPLDMVNAGGLWVFLDMLRDDPAMKDQRYQAYVLATAMHETGADFRCREERGSVASFAKYEPGTPIGKHLGNTEPGDGFRFRGRGYVQITGRGHYTRFSPIVDADLVEDPGLALKPEIAYQILSLGMTMGKFTGKKLADYIHGETCDFVNARRIVNGTDKADLIAGYAWSFESILREVPAVAA